MVTLLISSGRSYANYDDCRVGPLLSASALILVEEFGVGFTQITLLTGYHLCAVGAVSFISFQNNKR